MNFFDVYIEGLTKGNFNLFGGNMRELFEKPVNVSLKESRNNILSGIGGNSWDYSLYMIERLAEVGIESRLILSMEYFPEFSQSLIKASVLFKENGNWFVSCLDEDVKYFSENGINGVSRLNYMTAEGESVQGDDFVNNSKLTVEEFLEKNENKEREKLLQNNTELNDDILQLLVVNLIDIRASELTLNEAITKQIDLRDSIDIFKKNGCMSHN